MTTRKNGSLVVVGTGIKFLSHLTVEAKAYIEQSEKVLYLTNEPAIDEWIQKTNQYAESLDYLYCKYPRRSSCYQAISDYIIENVKKNLNVCVVFYGHPIVFAQPALEAVLQLKKEGFFTKILPGISAEDCLFADLLVDPGTHGCQSFEATDFLLRQFSFSSYSHLLLWQVGIIGALGEARHHCNRHGSILLRDYLLRFYYPAHEIILYEAAQYPHMEPCLQYLPLQQLPEALFSAVSTLYIPPIATKDIDKEMLKKLNL